MLSSLAGYTNIIGWPDRGPVNPYGAYTDFVCPEVCGVRHPGRGGPATGHGPGTHLDMSQLETSLHFSGPMLLDAGVNGREPDLVGNRHPSASPHGAYPCAPDANGEPDRVDCDCGIHRWAMGRLARRDHRRRVHGHRVGEFRTFRVRKAHEDKLDGIIADWT